MKVKIKHVAIGFAALVVGCAAKPQTSGQLNDRLTNASQISDTPQHDDTVAGVAMDAANSAQPEPCLSAVDAIKDRDKRDRTAHAAADIFNNRGDRPTAEALVAKISDPNLKDQIRQAYGRNPAPSH